jgi:hypothetical protein
MAGRSGLQTPGPLRSTDHTFSKVPGSYLGRKVRDGHRSESRSAVTIPFIWHSPSSFVRGRKNKQSRQVAMLLPLMLCLVLRNRELHAGGDLVP